MEAEAAGTALQAGELHALADLLAGFFDEAAPGSQPDGQLDRLDQLEALERIKSAAAAAQVVVTGSFADTADAEDLPVTGRRTPPRAMSIGAEVALATLTSPYGGEQRVLLSRRLRDDLPLTWPRWPAASSPRTAPSPSPARSPTSPPSSAGTSTPTSHPVLPAWAMCGCALPCAAPA